MLVDIIVVAVLLISAIIAFLRGFIREVLTILGVVGGAAAAYAAGPSFAVYIKSWLGVQEGVEPERLFGIIPYPLVADALAYGGIFITVVIVLSVISHMLAVSARTLGLGAIDRTFGVIFGLVRGALLLGLLYLPVYLLVDKETKISWFSGSRTYFYLEQTSAGIANLLPDSTRKKLESDMRKIQESAEAQQKVQEIDLLKEQREREAQEKQQQQQQEAPPDENAPQEGYNEDFRGKMDQLFEQKNRQEHNE